MESEQKATPVFCSPSIDKIAAALAKTQGKMEVLGHDEKAQATSTRSYGYASLGAVIEAVHEIAAENGLALVQRPDGDFLHTVLIHTSGQWIDYGYYPLGTAHKHQDRGSAITYARRYVALAVYQVPVKGDDDDGVAGNDSLMAAPKPKHVPVYVPAPQYAAPAAPPVVAKSPFGTAYERDTWLIMYGSDMDQAQSLVELKEARNRRIALVEQMKTSGNENDALALDDIGRRYAAALARLKKPIEEGAAKTVDAKRRGLTSQSVDLPFNDEIPFALLLPVAGISSLLLNNFSELISYGAGLIG